MIRALCLALLVVAATALPWGFNAGYGYGPAALGAYGHPAAYGAYGHGLGRGVSVLRKLLLNDFH